jgi:Tfp pilus assembly protein PilN
VINKLNLSTHPFRNRTLPFLITLVILAVAIGATVLGFAQLRDIHTQDEIAQDDIKRLEADLASLKGEGEKVQQALTPEQTALLVAAHKLVALKGFGWSRLFSDLEQVLPGTVSVSRITVQNVDDTSERPRADLEFAVLSRDYPSVMNMIDSMNSSGVFQAELRGQDFQKTDAFSYTEYTLRLIYTPRYGFAPGSDSTNTVASNQQGGNQ